MLNVRGFLHAAGTQRYPAKERCMTKAEAEFSLRATANIELAVSQAANFDAAPWKVFRASLRPTLTIKLGHAYSNTLAASREVQRETESHHAPNGPCTIVIMKYEHNAHAATADVIRTMQTVFDLIEVEVGKSGARNKFWLRFVARHTATFACNL
jgi:hypothetical protein